ncbi:hypothetical protein A2U01_0050518, partial [Trifolium medium]|nr:hypothetical protein [Trifolium medium]
AHGALRRSIHSNKISLCQLRSAPSSMARCAVKMMKKLLPSGSCAARR